MREISTVVSKNYTSRTTLAHLCEFRISLCGKFYRTKHPKFAAPEPNGGSISVNKYTHRGRFDKKTPSDDSTNGLPVQSPGREYNTARPD